MRGIVIYDGGFTMDQGSDSVNQTIGGFYQASTNNPSAQMSLIVGDAQPNFPERLRFNGFELTNPAIGSTLGPWDSPTWNVSQYLPGDASSASVVLDHVGTPYDCLTGGVMILGTTVQDADFDGLLDDWETSEAGYTCPPRAHPPTAIRSVSHFRISKRWARIHSGRTSSSKSAT